MQLARSCLSIRLHLPNLAIAGVLLQSSATLPHRATDSVSENTPILRAFNFRAIDFTARHRGGAGFVRTHNYRDLDMSTSDNAPLLGKAASSRRRRGAALAAVALALAGGLALAVANRSDTTTSLITPGGIVVDGITTGTPQDTTKLILTEGPANNAIAEHTESPANPMMQLNSGLHGKVGSIEKWCGAASRRLSSRRRRADAATPHPRRLLIVIIVLGAVCLLCCVCCIIHVGTCGIL